MEKLLEQEALLEQQDPKVRCARLHPWSLCEQGPDGSMEACGQEGQRARLGQDASVPSWAWKLGRWMLVHSLLVEPSLE